MNISEIYNCKKEIIQNIKEKRKENGYGTHIKLIETLDILEDRLKKKRVKRDQLDQEIRDLEKRIKEKRAETEIRQEKRQRLYDERAKKVEINEFTIKFIKTFFVMEQENQYNENKEEEDKLFNKTDQNQIRDMLDKKYSLFKLQNQLYYFFRGSVFGIGKNIMTSNEKKICFN